MRVEDSLREMFDQQLYFFPVPATVDTFSATKQTASVRPEIKIDGVQADIIQDVPVLMPAGAGFEIDFHLVQGDRVLLLFCARDIQMWREGSDAKPELEKPRLSNAVAIPGLAQITGKTAGTSTGVTIKNTAGSSLVRVDNTGVTVTAPTVTITGAVSITGSLTVNGIIFNAHVHADHDPVSGRSGPPIN